MTYRRCMGHAITFQDSISLPVTYDTNIDKNVAVLKLSKKSSDQNENSYWFTELL